MAKGPTDRTSRKPRGEAAGPRWSKRTGPLLRREPGTSSHTRKDQTRVHNRTRRFVGMRTLRRRAALPRKALPAPTPTGVLLHATRPARLKTGRRTGPAVPVRAAPRDVWFGRPSASSKQTGGPSWDAPPGTRTSSGGSDSPDKSVRTQWPVELADASSTNKKRWPTTNRRRPAAVATTDWQEARDGTFGVAVARGTNRPRTLGRWSRSLPFWPEPPSHPRRARRTTRRRTPAPTPRATSGATRPDTRRPRTQSARASRAAGRLL